MRWERYITVFLFIIAVIAISESFSHAVVIADALGTVTRNTSIMAGPDSNSGRYRKVSEGEFGVVLEESEDGRWYKMRMKADGQAGWVPARLVRVRGDVPKAASGQIPEAKSEEKPKPKVVKKTTVGTLKNSTVVRSDPKLDAEKLKRVQAGDRGNVLGESSNGRWLLMVFPDGIKGWVPKRLVNQEKKATPIPILAPVAAPAGAAEPEPKPEVKPVPKPEPEAKPEPEPEPEKYSDDLEIGTITTSTIMRAKTSTKSPSVRRVGPGDKARVLALSENGKWLKMRFPDGTTGYVPKRFVKVEKEIHDFIREESKKSVTRESKYKSKPKVTYTTLVLMPLVPEGRANDELSEKVGEIVIEKLIQHSGRNALPAEDAWMLKANPGDPPDCAPHDNACLTSIGRTLHVRQVVSGSIKSEGRLWVLTLYLAEMADERVINERSLSLDPHADDLGIALDHAIPLLLAPPKPKSADETPVITTVVTPPPPKKESKPFYTLVSKPKKKKPKVEYRKEHTAMWGWGWGVFATGLAANAVGITGISLAIDAGKSYKNDGSASAKNDNKTWSTVAISGFAAGGALVVTGIGLLVADAAEMKKPLKSASIGIAPDSSGGLVLTLEGRW